MFGWTADEAASFAVLDTFVAAGGTMIDTADSYAHWLGHGGGESESILGRWLASRGGRDRVLIATKVGKHPDARGLSAGTIRGQLTASLRRLGTDHVDLYYSHEDDPSVPLEETLGAFDQLVREGSVRHLGASNFTAARLVESLDVSARDGLARYVALQPLYNLVERERYESELAPVCVAREVGVLPYYGLARGFLTGKYRRGERSEARGGAVAAYENPAGQRALDAVLDIAGRHRTTPAAVALAWLTTRPGVVAPIASARSLEQLLDLLPALTLELSEQDLADLDAHSSPSAA